MISVDYVLANVTVTSTDCWLWGGYLNEDGYGRAYDRETRKHVYVHRYMAAAMYGSIPPNMEVDHRCCQPRCCNPYHLEIVTQAENLRRKYERGESLLAYQKRLIGVTMSRGAAVLRRQLVAA